MNSGGLVLLILLIGATVTAGLLLLNWLFPLIDTRRSDELGDAVLRPSASRVFLPVPILPRAAGEAPQGELPLPPERLRRYWRTQVGLSTTLLLIWGATVLLPPLFAEPLNRIRLAGFPLGYLLSAQGALLVFVALIIGYDRLATWLERRYDAGARPQRAPHGWRRPTALTLAFAGLVIVLVLLETSGWLPPQASSWLLLVTTLLTYAIIGLRSRSHTLAEYYVAGRRVPPLINGLAIGADWMSAATFVALAGTLWRLGYEGLAYVMGWTGGYVLLAVLIAPYLRRFGQYTVPDFIGARYGPQARIVAAILSIIISFTYLTAQVTGVGIIMSQFLDVRYLLGVLVGLSAVLFCSFWGGMRAITWTQVAQCIILLIAYLVPVTWLAYRITGVPLPQLTYGRALNDIAALEQQLHISEPYVAPFNDWTRANFIALALCLMMGTAGLPHLLARCLTTPSVGATRRSISWGILAIVLLYSAIPAYAAFARREMLTDVIGRRLSELPAWIGHWERVGYLRVEDRNRDDYVQPDELEIREGVIVLAAPQMGELPHTITALVAVGGLAAALSTADGLLMVIAAAVAHDLYYRTYNPRASARRRLLLGRSMVLLAATLAALTALRRLGIIEQMVAWAFSLATATLFPALVLGIFWKRANGKGVVAGMLAGLAVTLSYMLTTLLDPDLALLGIGDRAAGIWGLPSNLLVTWLVSQLTSPPTRETRALVDLVRSPERHADEHASPIRSETG